MTDPYGVFIIPRSTLSSNHYNERKCARNERKHDERLMNLSSESDDEFYEYAKGISGFIIIKRCQ